jgi:hypothetical protein
MPSDAVNLATRREWRDLGFFYDRDDQSKVWTLVGSRNGLLRFRDILFAYVADARNAKQSEHEHYGPYSYLEIMTWPDDGFDDHAIRGPLANLARLAALIETKLAKAHPGSSIKIQTEFATDSPYALILDLREDEFDPATADPMLPLEENSLNTLKAQVEKEGFAVIPACINESTLQMLSAEFHEIRDPERNLLSLQSVQTLATSKPVREIMETLLGPKCFAVRGIFFNKTRSSNWKVVWHQDLTIAVRDRIGVDGFGPWTRKAGIWHVQPPPEVLSNLLALRLHIDESKIDNGPLRVIPGSHCKGRLSAEQIGNWDKKASVVCTVPKGGALVMRPLLLHASSACAVPTSRRVIHLEFAAADLAHGLSWYDKVSTERSIQFRNLSPTTS